METLRATSLQITILGVAIPLFQQLRCVVFGIDLADGIDDNALLINDVGGAQRAFGHLAVHFLLAPCLVGFQDGEAGVSDEMERQLIFGNKLLM